MQNFQIVVVQDDQTLSAIAAIPSLPTEAFLRENAAQLSASEAELRERKVGLLATSFPISWRSPDAQPIHTSDSGHAFIGSAMKDCPALLVVAYDSRTRAPGSEGDMLGMMSLGCVMQNMWLMADALGISTQILSVLSSDAAERKLRTILKLPIFYRIAFGCRLGYQKPSREKYLRVRRDIGDFAHAGQFGNRSLR
jgi:nitroreductase